MREERGGQNLSSLTIVDCDKDSYGGAWLVPLSLWEYFLPISLSLSLSLTECKDIDKDYLPNTK